MSFTAKYPGTCAACDEEIRPGERVAFTDDRDVVHVVCPDDTDAYGRPLPVCPACFLAIPASGECGCAA